MPNEKKAAVKTAADNVITLKSVYGKVGQKLYIMPAKDPKTNRLPECVKHVDSKDDMILTDKERNSGEYFIKETEVIVVQDGTTFNLDDEVEAKQWEAIKNCIFIAPERDARDSKGNLLIDGTEDKNRPERSRYGAAELYVFRPGVESQKRLSKKKLIHNACSYIIDDPQGNEGRVLRARLLGKNMKHVPSADVEDYLLQIAEKDPKRIIDLYTGDDLSLRLLFMDAKEKRVIYRKDSLYMYADNVVLGATDDAVLTWMKTSKNKKTLELIRRDTNPELYADEK